MSSPLRCVVLWGHAPSKSNPIGLYPMILQAQKNGAQLIVVDPRRIPEAEKADMWLPIRPGTDVALMLGWLRIIIEKKFYDVDFVANWTIGFEDLKTAVADYVFPICSTVETTELWLTPSFCVACPRGVDPLYERRNTYDFWRGLAIRLGQNDHWPWQTVDDMWDYRLAPVGLTFNQLLEQNGIFGRPQYKRYEKFGFGTPSGKVELRSTTFEELGCEPLPVYREHSHSPLGDSKLAESFPLVIISGSRFMPMYHSEQRQIQAARKKRPDPLVTLHPDTAEALELTEGEWVKVESPQGSIRMRLRLSDTVQQRMADADHGWWFPERREEEPELFGVFESNANVLCPDGSEFCSPEIGSWPHSALLCRVKKED